MNLISLPVDFIGSLTAYIGGIFDSLSPLILLAIGLPLGFWFIGRMIGTIKKGVGK